MRTGKTKCLVDDWGEMVEAGKVDDLLVIAPGGVYLTWKEAIGLDLPGGIAGRLQILVWESRRARTKAAELQRASFLAYTGPRALLVNVEAISSVEAARTFITNMLVQRRRRAVVAVDESIVIKSPTSICGKFCSEVLGPLAGYRRIMTGLVSPRSPLDLYNQFKFLDPAILGFGTFATFRSRYAKVKQVCMVPNDLIQAKLWKRLGLDKYLTDTELRYKVKALNPEMDPEGMTGPAMRSYLETMADVMKRDQKIEAVIRLGGYLQTVPVVEGYENVEELHRKIQPHSFRVRLEDCYDMPASDYSFRDVELTEEQRRVYEGIRQNATVQLESLDHVTATHVIVQILRLHQVLCGHVVDEEGKQHEIPEKRTEALVDLLQDYEGKAVVWCSYDLDVKKVSSRLAAEFGESKVKNVARFWGSNQETREMEEEAFKTDPECRFMVATPHAGGKGRTWDVADLSIYYSNLNNLDHRAQSEERVKAVDKKRPVAYVDLRARGTVDDKIIKALREKIDLAAIINGDTWREWLI